jgi:serine/threonine protein kinase
MRSLFHTLTLTYIGYNSGTTTETTIRQPNEIGIDELEIGKELGQGRYGRVCIGKWKTKNIRVALKFYQNKSEINEFMREMNLMISIPPHRNVVRMFGVSIDGTQPIIVMEYCDSGIYSPSLLFHNIYSQITNFTHSHICTLMRIHTLTLILM